MNLNKLILIFTVLIFLYSCADYKTSKTDPEDTKKYYSSSGFALIYEEDFYKKKVVNKKLNIDDLLVMHSFLKRNTPIKIINPSNSKVFETKIHKKGDYPKIFNIVITEKIASFLELEADNPFVEILEVKKNKTFIAKEGSIFDEEKNVADKAPVEKIKMNDLTINKDTKNEKKVEKNNFVLVVNDFYYIDSANNLKNELIKKVNINNIYVKKINNNKYRLLIGPFKSFNALKTVYISLNNLGFESLNIYKE